MLQQMRFSVPEAQGKSFAVEATWTAKGGILFSVDDQPLRPIAMDHPPASVTLVISGAKGEFGEVQAGRSGPAPANCSASTPTP